MHIPLVNARTRIIISVFISKPNFISHMSSLCKKASQKLHTVARVPTFMGPGNLRLLMNSFINAQFSYCPLIWMFHDRCLNATVNKIHERALRMCV